MPLTQSNPYPWGQCTWYAFSRASSWLPFSALGNGSNADLWFSRAQSHGLPVGSTPIAGAVAVWGANRGGAGPVGHVAYVESVGKIGPTAGLPTVSEMNVHGLGVLDTRPVSASSAAGIIGYIYPPGSSVTASPSPVTSSGGAAAPVSAVATAQTGVDLFGVSSAVNGVLTWCTKAGEVVFGLILMTGAAYILMKSAPGTGVAAATGMAMKAGKMAATAAV